MCHFSPNNHPFARSKIQDTIHFTMSSMAYNSAGGLGGMLKSGTRLYSQEDDPHSAAVVLRNIDACLELSHIMCTSYGPQGRNKLIVNHLEKMFVTSDCATILKEINVEHPAAQLLTQAVLKQEEEYGDQTNLVLSLAGELLYQTSLLIAKMTWQPATEILLGYKLALDKCINEYLPKLVCDTVTDVLDNSQMEKVLLPVLASKMYGMEQTLAPLVASACRIVMAKVAGKKTSLNVDQVRTVKILGSSVSQSMVIEGYVATREVETVRKSVIASDSGDRIKVVVFACGFEASSTESKGTVVMKNADDLKSYNKSEEEKMNEIVESIANTGVQVIVAGGNVSDMALHFLDRYNLLCLKVSSKWELRRLCQAVNATALVRLGPPTPEEIGHATSVSQKEIGGRTVTVVENNLPSGGSMEKSKLATIVLRASTTSVLNDLERAVDDGVRAISSVCTDGRLVYGGGCTEMALSCMLNRMAKTLPGLEQYAVSAFATALQIIPKTLAENAGWNTTQVMTTLQAAHSTALDTDAICDIGIDIDRESSSLGTISMKGVANEKSPVVDLLCTKMSALRLAVDVAITILKVDQIIMSKQARGGNDLQAPGMQ
jgi:T-complex protein 1 subunit theta